MTYAIGDDSVPLDGYEVSDLSIDPNFSAQTGTSAGVGGIKSRGKNLYIRRVRVSNFGHKQSDQPIAGISAAGDSSENCVIDSWVVEFPATTNSVGRCMFFQFNGSAVNPHRFCAIRNCAVRGVADTSPPPAVSPIHFAISPGVGTGTILEGNQIANVAAGVTDVWSSLLGSDLVAWNNYFRNVWKGFFFTRTSGTGGRIIAADNIIEVGITLTAPDPNLGSPTGIHFAGTGSDRYGQLIVRKNQIRYVNDPTAPTTNIYGVDANSATNAIVENNVINNTVNDATSGRAVKYANCGTAKFFNNEDATGALLRGFNGTAFKSELQDAVEDVVLSF